MDLFGALAGVAIGAAFAPTSQAARAQYVIQGATHGAGAPFKAVEAGIGGTVGFGALGTKGIPIGIQKGIPGVIQQSAKDVTSIFSTGTIVLIAAAAVVGILILKE